MEQEELRLLPGAAIQTVRHHLRWKPGKDIRHLWLANYTVSVQFPSVSGFEILEMLQARSHLALIESNLSPAERTELESADATFLAYANELYASLSEMTDLSELRTKMNVPPSHWWWHLDKLVQRKQEAVAV
jgi:hypothetical protein